MEEISNSMNQFINSSSINETNAILFNEHDEAEGDAYTKMTINLLEILLTILGIFLSLVTIVGNVLVMIAFKVDKTLQTISNYFLLSLALADFLIGLVSMPLSLVYILSEGWPLGPLVCDAWLAIDYLNSNASVLNLLLISFDRYFSVTRPLTYRARRTTKRACAMIAGAWLVSALLWPPWIFAWPAIEGRRTVPRDQCYIPFLESNIWVTISTALIAFWLPVSLMCVLYWRIWRETERRYKDLTTLVLVSHSLSSQSSRSSTRHSLTATHCWHNCCHSCCATKASAHSTTSINAPSTETPPTSESIYTIVIQLERANCGEHNATVTMITTEDDPPPSPPPTRIRAPIQPKSERKAAKTLSAILLAFIVTWTPYNILVFVKTFSPSSVDSDGIWWQFSYYLCYINSTLNPLCYALCNINFRNTYTKILTCRTTSQQRQQRQQQAMMTNVTTQLRHQMSNK